MNELKEQPDPQTWPWVRMDFHLAGIDDLLKSQEGALATLQERLDPRNTAAILAADAISVSLNSMRPALDAARKLAAENGGQIDE